MKNERDKNGQFKSGNSAGQGRPKGSRNRITDEIRETFLNFINSNLEGLQKDFDKLDPKERFDVIFKLSKFVLPTLKAVEFGNALGELSDEDLTALVEKLKEDQLN